MSDTEIGGVGTTVVESGSLFLMEFFVCLFGLVKKMHVK